MFRLQSNKKHWPIQNENLNCNSCLARGTKYRQNNPEKQKQRYQRYYEEHKERLLEEKKEYRQNNSEKIKQISQRYYEEDKERLLEEKKEYRKDYNQREEECEICKCKYKKPHSSKHRKTKMHLANLEKLENEITN